MTTDTHADTDIDHDGAVLILAKAAAVSLELQKLEGGFVTADPLERLAVAATAAQIRVEVGVAVAETAAWVRWVLLTYLP